MFDFLRVLGTKNFFEKGTIVLQGLVQDGGAMISSLLVYTGWTRARMPASYSAASEIEIKLTINKNITKTFL